VHRCLAGGQASRDTRVATRQKHLKQFSLTEVLAGCMDLVQGLSHASRIPKQVILPRPPESGRSQRRVHRCLAGGQASADTRVATRQKDLEQCSLMDVLVGCMDLVKGHADSCL
jgi:hypothetical protein